MNVILVLILGVIFLIPIALCVTPQKEKKIRYVIDEEHQEAANRYNHYAKKIRTLDEKFTNELSLKQKDILLNQDFYAHQQCIYLVSEYNETVDIINERLNSIRNLIDARMFRQSEVQLTDIDDDIQYLNELCNTLKNVSVNNIQMKCEKSSFVEREIKERQLVSYFDDCKTREELITRYKALAKVFHPDAKAGNEMIFKNIKEEFDKKVQEIPR